MSGSPASGIALALLLSIAPPTTGEDPPAPPLLTLQLEVGDLLTYDFSTRFTYEGGAQLSSGVRHILVVSREADGGYRLAVREETTITQQRQQDRHVQAPRVVYGEQFVAADGSEHHDLQLFASLDPRAVFPMLPSAQRPASSSWVELRENGDRDHYRCSEVPGSESTGSTTSDPDGPTCREIRLERRVETPFDRIYGASYRAEYTIERTRGVPIRIESRNRRRLPLEGQGTATWTLRGVERWDPVRVSRAASDLDALVSALTRLARANRRAQRDADTARAKLEEAAESARALAETISNEEMRRVLELQIQRQRASHGAIVDMAERRGRMVGTRAPEWSLPRVTGGGDLSAKEFAGRPLVIGFWYRRNAWSIRVLRLLDQLAGQFRDRGVAFVGITSDGEEDARAVVEGCATRFPQLLGGKVHERFAVRVFPAVAVVDGTGVVRELSFGYTPELGRELASRLRSILEESP